MRMIEWTGQFKRDYKREAKGKHRTTLDVELFSVITSLAND
jgi:mRNA interferase YafQ